MPPGELLGLQEEPDWRSGTLVDHGICLWFFTGLQLLRSINNSPPTAHFNLPQSGPARTGHALGHSLGTKSFTGDRAINAELRDTSNPQVAALALSPLLLVEERGSGSCAPKKPFKAL